MQPSSLEYAARSAENKSYPWCNDWITENVVNEQGYHVYGYFYISPYFERLARIESALVSFTVKTLPC